jgi:predicted MPP superfamily phosphohydrolase
MKTIFKKKWIWCLAIAFVFLILFACDVRLKTVCYSVESDKITAPVRIALLTDLHSCRYGKNQENLIEAVQKQNPDIVLLGGDIFDDKIAYDNAEITVRQLAEQYP